jgi:hypothetical protein
MLIKKIVALAAVLTALLATGFGATTRENTHPAAYPTRCLHVTLPPDGRPLPEVCVVYPI